MSANAHFKLDEFKVSANIYASGKAIYIGPSAAAILNAIKYMCKIVPKFRIKEEAKKRPVLTRIDQNKPLKKSSASAPLPATDRGRLLI